MPSRGTGGKLLAWCSLAKCYTRVSMFFYPPPPPHPKYTYDTDTYVIGYLGPELKIFTEQG